MTLLTTLKATIMLLGIVIMIFIVLVLAEFVFFAFLEKMDERARRRTSDRQGWRENNDQE